MSYSINYAPKDSVRYKKKAKHRLPALALALLLAAFAVKRIWPEETQKLRQALFPLTQSAVQEAFADLAHNMQEGESFQNAVTTFCLEILGKE